MGFRTPGTGDRLRASIGEGLREQELLRHHTTFRIGGPADWFLAARTHDQLVTALSIANELSLPTFLLGGGSNLLVSDEGFRGLVVKNAIEDAEFDGTTARVGCGADYLTFIQQCSERALAGLA
ncbi:MAG: FAD-binding protein [Deltaproteobacteria bacterium]|nr:MAG: FAD-binding protein [Deltaproteobacteria bacterium]